MSASDAQMSPLHRPNSSPSLSADSEQVEHTIPAGTICRVVVSFIPEEQEELHLDVDDLVYLTHSPSQNNGYWWRGINRGFGMHNGETGWFPSSHVVILPDDQISSTTPNPSVVSTEASPTTSDYVLSCISATNAADEGSDISSFAQMLGDINLIDNAPSRTSSHPLDEFQSTNKIISTILSGDIINRQENSASFTVPIGAKVIARYSYTRTKADEISFTTDDIITVTEAPDGGWWKGTNESATSTHSTISGWFPSSLVIPTDQLELDPKKSQSSTSPFATEPPPISIAVHAPPKLSVTESIHTFDESNDQVTPIEVVTKITGSLNLVEGKTPHQSWYKKIVKRSSAPSISTSHSNSSPIPSSSAESTHLNITEDSLISPLTHKEELHNGTQNGKGHRARSRSAPAEIQPTLGYNDEIADKLGLTSTEKSRQKVIWELINTEKSYIADLNVIIEAIFFESISSSICQYNW
ncbi:hypothetical protein BKA69DRAFT_1035806 [Paraphysoderma sedebokerense]|nr:hypothetical protein BKA69DRAFT_1035806 [Paraphysoderma sedebokerense]